MKANNMTDAKNDNALYSYYVLAFHENGQDLFLNRKENHNEHLTGYTIGIYNPFFTEKFIDLEEAEFKKQLLANNVQYPYCLVDMSEEEIFEITQKLQPRILDFVLRA